MLGTSSCEPRFFSPLDDASLGFIKVVDLLL